MLTATTVIFVILFLVSIYALYSHATDRDNFTVTISLATNSFILFLFMYLIFIKGV